MISRKSEKWIWQTQASRPCFRFLRWIEVVELESILKSVWRFDDDGANILLIAVYATG